jgi:uncharacterized protein involved in response to NO
MELRIAFSVRDAPAWRREPYRVFFPLGAALAWAGILHWLLFALGVSDEYRSIFHSMAQIQGFLACFAVGFLFTMIPRRTGTPPPAPWQMAIGLAAPIGTTVCAWFERWALAQVFWLALLAVVIGFALRRFREGDVPPSFVWVIGALAFGASGAVLAGFGAATERMWLHDVGRGLVLQGVMTGLILGVGGFLIPAICRAAPPGHLPRLAHLGLALLFIASFWMEADAIRPALALRAAAVGWALIPSARLWLRPTMPGLHRRLVWIAAWMMPIGYAFVAALPEYRRIGLHIVFIGCYALMTLSVSVHVVLSHGGRAELLDGAPRPLVAVAGLLALALACRLLVDLDPAHFNLWLGIAAASFLVATVCWARLVLRRPRPAESAPHRCTQPVLQETP